MFLCSMIVSFIDIHYSQQPLFFFRCILVYKINHYAIFNIQLLHWSILGVNIKKSHLLAILIY